VLLAGKSDGVSPSEDVAKTTLAKIAALARERPLVYLPSHDPQSEERLVNRSVLAIEKAGLC